VTQELGLDPASVVWLRQVHGSEVAVVRAGTIRPSPLEPRTADAAVTDEPGTVLTVMTADCAPIALVAPGAVAVVHAGWPGLLAGVVAAAAGELRRVDDGPVTAVLGPCIHPGQYEFGASDLARLVNRFGPSVEARTAWGTPAFDLPVAVRRALREEGIDRVEDADLCTYALTNHFSHRRDGVTGRQALFAWIEP